MLNFDLCLFELKPLTLKDLEFFRNNNWFNGTYAFHSKFNTIKDSLSDDKFIYLKEEDFEYINNANYLKKIGTKFKITEHIINQDFLKSFGFSEVGISWELKEEKLYIYLHDDIERSYVFDITKDSKIITVNEVWLYVYKKIPILEQQRIFNWLDYSSMELTDFNNNSFSNQLNKFRNFIFNNEFSKDFLIKFNGNSLFYIAWAIF